MQQSRPHGLHELRQLGIRLAIDDFGTGYSSLSYLRQFPVDILKVDKSFIDLGGGGGEGDALTRAVVELAGILDLMPVAEGIERAEQLEGLCRMHCDFGQGFLFSEAVAPNELESLIANSQVPGRRPDPIGEQHECSRQDRGAEGDHHDGCSSLPCASG